MICYSGKSLPCVILMLCLRVHHFSNKPFFYTVSICILVFFSLSPSFITPPRAQEVFRQAMHSPVVRLEVVPSSNRERYEKSLIGQLFDSGAGSDGSPRITKAKVPPPPVKAKPTYKPSETPAPRYAEDVATMEAAVSVSRSAPSQHVLLEMSWLFLSFKSDSICKLQEPDYFISVCKKKLTKFWDAFAPLRTKLLYGFLHSFPPEHTSFASPAKCL